MLRMQSAIGRELPQLLQAPRARRVNIAIERALTERYNNGLLHHQASEDCAGLQFHKEASEDTGWAARRPISRRIIARARPANC